MRRQSLAVLAAALALVAFGRAADDAAKKEWKQLEGTWTTTSAEIDTQALPEEVIEKLTLTIKGNTLTVAGNEGIAKQYGKMTLTIDPSVTPKIIDFKITAGDEKGTVLEGIYELKGNELKLCVKVMGKERPGTFETKEDSKSVLLVLKRQKS